MSSPSNRNGNLFSTPPARWDHDLAADRATGIIVDSAGAPLVLLGAQVAGAFGLDFQPFGVGLIRGVEPALVAILPHPSGRCRLWNEPSAYERAREAIASVAPQVLSEPVQ